MKEPTLPNLPLLAPPGTGRRRVPRGRKPPPESWGRGRDGCKSAAPGPLVFDTLSGAKTQLISHPPRPRDRDAAWDLV